jgi:4-methyl-5(b-hydroxyethyl)-thiazole monophosphate biosynthesis
VGKMAKVLVAVADGSEDIETITVVDVLRRAAVDVVVASITGNLQVTLSRKTVLVADRLLEECVDVSFDMIVLPGGMPGAKSLGESSLLINLIRTCLQDEQKWIAAICAAPAVALYPNGLLEGYQATCYPSFSKDLPENIYVNESVVISKNCITSQSPATAMKFSLTLVEVLLGYDKACAVAKPMLFDF